MALKKFAFNVLKKDKFARCGLIETHRGNIHTPAFNFGWQRIDLFRNPTCLAQSYKFQLLD